MSDVHRDPPTTQAWTARVEPALAAAEQYLTKTLGAMHPGTSAARLLRIATGQRRHLAALASACRDLDPARGSGTTMPLTDRQTWQPGTTSSRPQ